VAYGEREFSDVRIWGAAKPVGMAFMLDPTHVMTCAHVVATALGNEKLKDADATPAGEIKVDFPALGAGEIYPSRKAVVETWRPATLAQGPDGGPPPRDDVAVLRLTTPAPPGMRGATACVILNEGDPFRAFGITASNPEGIQVSGRYTGVRNATRRMVSSDELDARPQPGCSGGAAWSISHGGVMGMIVARKQEKSGEFIPIQCLRNVWAIPPAPSVDAPPALQAAASGPSALSRRLSEQLRIYDRQPQLAELETALDDLWTGKRRPIACLVACRTDDRPELLQSRFISEQLRARLEALNVHGQKLLPQELRWPKEPRLKVEAQLRNLKTQIKQYLPGMAEVDAAGVRAAYNDSKWPLAFFSRIYESVFDDSHEALLAEWLRFWADVGEGDLKKPLVVFVRLILDDGSPGALRTVFERHSSVPPSPLVRSLPELSAFDQDELLEWLQSALDEPDLVHQPTVEASLRQAVGGRPTRLDALLTWAAALEI
jgi:hypothetical protein